VFKLMLKYAVSEDGRLHAEKYYNTVREEYGTTRRAFRWRQVVGLARVTASAYGYNRRRQKRFPRCRLRRRLQTARCRIVKPGPSSHKRTPCQVINSSVTLS
jgi:hypothetical protein